MKTNRIRFINWSASITRCYSNTFTASCFHL